MKLNTLFVSSFVPATVPFWTPFTSAITANYWISAIDTRVARTRNKASLQLPLQTGTNLTAISLNELASGQQHIYTTVGRQPINYAPTAINIIQLSNGRSPHITKQDIL
jgi:hypothetical protein